MVAVPIFFQAFNGRCPYFLPYFLRTKKSAAALFAVGWIALLGLFYFWQSS